MWFLFSNVVGSNFQHIFQFQYTCKIAQCQHRCRRDKLATHYMEYHRMGETQAEKMIPENILSQSDDREFKCEFCNHTAQLLLLRIHMFQTHKQINAAQIDLMIEGKMDKKKYEIDNKMKEIEKMDSKPRNSTPSTPQIKTPSLQNKILTPQIKTQTPVSATQTPQNKTQTYQDKGKMSIKCLAPGCKNRGAQGNKMFKAENMHK